MAEHQLSASSQNNDSFSSSKTITPPRPGSAGSRKRGYITSDSRSEQSELYGYGEAMVPGGVHYNPPLLCIGMESPQTYCVRTEGTTYGGPLAKNRAVEAIQQETLLNKSSSPTNSPSGSPERIQKNSSKPGSRDSVRTQSPREESRSTAVSIPTDSAGITWRLAHFSSVELGREILM